LATEGALTLANGAAGTAALPSGADQPLIGEVPREDQPLLEDWTPQRGRTQQKRLEQLIDHDEAQAAAILKQWIRHGERA
jgi:flagellar M-ring protein FliF